jgi:TP901 family phage tail tape measure protein
VSVSDLKSQAAALSGMAVQANKATASIKQTDAALAKAATSAAKFGDAAGLALRRFAGFSLAAGSVLAVVHAFSDGIKEAVAFSHGMNRLAIISGKSVSQLGDLKSRIEGLGTSLGVNQKELLSVSDTLLQAGLSSRKAEVALSALAKTKLSPTFGDIRDSAEGVISLLGQFGGGVEKLEGQLGSINRVSARYAVESQDLIEAVRKSGAVFHQAGGSLEQLLGLFTAVRSKTRESASSIAVGFKTIFANLEDPARINKLEKLLNIKLSSGGKALDPFSQIARLSASLKHEDPGSLLFASVAKEIGGIRQLGKTIPLLKEFATAVEATGVAEQGSGSLAEDAAKAQNSLLVQLEKVRAEYDKLYHRIVDSAGFQATTKVVFGLATAFAKVADSLVPLLPALQTLATIKIGGALAGAAPAFFRRITGHASGGVVGGVGSGDNQLARLTPGEFVLQKSAVQAIGVGNLNKLNNVRGYRKGGLVGDDGGLYGFQNDGLSQKIAKLISVIEDEIKITRNDLAERRAQRSGVYSVGPVQAPVSAAARRKAAVANLLTIPLAGHNPRDTVYRSAPVTYGIEDIAAAALNGPATASTAGILPYSLAGTARQRRASLGRGHSRAARQAFIDASARAIRGNVPEDSFEAYGDFLGNLRISRLKPASDAALSARGILPRNSLSQSLLGRGRIAVGNGLSSVGRFARGNARLAGFSLAALALSGQGEGAARLAGGERGASAFTGAISGGLTGFTAGSVGGPIGAGIGAIGGAAAGVVKSLDDLRTKIDADRIDKGLEAIEDSATNLAKALATSKDKITPEVAKAAAQLFGTQAAGRGNIETAAAPHNTISGNLLDTALGYGRVAKAAFFGLSGGAGVGYKVGGIGGILGGAGQGYSIALRHLQDQDNLEKSRARIGNEVQLFSQGTAEKEVLRANLLSESRGVGDFSRSSLGQDYIASEAARRSSIEKQRIVSGPDGRNLRAGEGAEIEEKHRQAIAAEIAAIEKDTVARKANLAAVESFESVLHRQTAGLHKLTQALDDLSVSHQAADNLNALTLGATGSGPAHLSSTRLGNSLSKFGSVHLSGAADYLARVSPALAGQVSSLKVGNQLHAALTGFGLGGFANNDTLRSQLGARLQNAGISKDSDLFRHVFEKVEAIQGRPGDERKLLGGGKAIDDFRDDLLKPFEKLRESLETVGKGIDAQGSRLLEGFAKIADLSDQIGDQRDHSTSLRLDSARYRAGQLAERHGGDVTSYLGAGAGQIPFLQTQSRLTGLSPADAIDPAKLLGKVISLQAATRDSAAQVAANPGNAEAVARLRGFESATQNAVQALRNLADASKLNASLQERLATLDKDKEARLGLAEGYLRGSPKDRAAQAHAARATIRAVTNKKGLDSLSHGDVVKVLDFLDSAGEARLFGGEKTGSQLKTQLIRNSKAGRFFAPNAKDAAEASGLRSQIGGNLDRAGNASDALATVLEHTQSTFFSDLQANQRTFLEALGGTLGHAVKLPQAVAAPAHVAAAAAAVAPHVATAIGFGPTGGGFSVTGAGKPAGRLTGKARRDANTRLQYLRRRGSLGFSADEYGTPLKSAISEVKKSLGPPRQLPGAAAKRAAYDQARQDREDAYNQNKAARKAVYAGAHGGDPLAVFNQAIKGLSGPIGKFDEAVKKIPSDIKFDGTVRHEFVFNGQEVFATIMPEMQKLIEREASQIVNQKLKKNFPGANIQ